MDADAGTGVLYSYKVRAYLDAASGKQYYGGYGNTVSKCYVPKVSGLAGTKTTTEISLKWNELEGTAGYQVYRKAAGESAYTKVATTTDAQYKDTKIESGKKYYYKVRAYSKGSNGTTYYGLYSDVVSK